jgi:hypothetical protein
VQDEILAKNGAQDVRVYAVWFNMLFGDSRARWDGAGLVDSRVTHLWDEQKVVGNWYSANVTHQRGTTWDSMPSTGRGPPISDPRQLWAETIIT